jgi:ORF6N domain-containing protein
MAVYRTSTETVRRIEEMIFLIRGQRVMFDADLAKIYGVTTKQLNQQFKRNRKRFPEDFAFTLTNQEVVTMRSQFVTSSRRNFRRAPVAFTEHGALMLGNILNSKIAVEASIRVVRAFVWIREQLAANKELSQKLKELESRVGEHDEAISNLFEAIRQLLNPVEKPDREIGFHIRENSTPYRIRTKKRF